MRVELKGTQGNVKGSGRQSPEKRVMGERAAAIRAHRLLELLEHGDVVCITFQGRSLPLTCSPFAFSLDSFDPVLPSPSASRPRGSGPGPSTPAQRLMGARRNRDHALLPLDRRVPDRLLSRRNA